MNPLAPSESLDLSENRRKELVAVARLIGIGGWTNRRKMEGEKGAPVPGRRAFGRGTDFAPRRLGFLCVVELSLSYRDLFELTRFILTALDQK